MDNLYKAPKADLTESRSELPKLGWFIMLAFVLEGIFTMVINLVGSYEIDPINLMSFEMIIVLVVSLLLLKWIHTMIMNGQKALLTICYVFLGMLAIFDFQNWLNQGIFVGVGETLIFLNVILLIAVVIIIKIPMKNWFVN